MEYTLPCVLLKEVSFFFLPVKYSMKNSVLIWLSCIVLLYVCLEIPLLFHQFWKITLLGISFLAHSYLLEIFNSTFAHLLFFVFQCLLSFVKSLCECFVLCGTFAWSIAVGIGETWWWLSDGVAELTLCYLCVTRTKGRLYTDSKATRCSKNFGHPFDFVNLLETRYMIPTEVFLVCGGCC